MKKSTWYWIIGIIIVIALIYYGNKKGWFKKSTMPAGTSTNAAGRIVYDTARCCQPTNPCGWSSATYNRVCSGL